MIEILIGGSPCTHWSIAQSKNRETTATGIGWEMFENYVTAKEKFKPDIFLYENNKSAAQPIKDQIAQELGVGSDPKARFTYINSALVSAQNRQRFYVTNFGNIEQPEDRGILLKDILECGGGLSQKEKAYCLTASYDGACAFNTIERKQREMVAEPICVAQRGRQDERGIYVQCYEPRFDGKTNTITTVAKDNNLCEPVCMRYERTDIAKRLRKRYEAGEIKHGFNEHRELHPRTDGKSNTLSTVLKDNQVCAPVQTDPFEKSQPLQASYGKYAASDSFKKANPRTGAAEPVCMDYAAHKNSDIVVTEKSMQCQRNDKKHSTIQGTHVFFPKGKANTLATSHIPMAFAPIRVGTIENNSKNKKHDSRQYRVYSTSEKSITLCGGRGGLGTKTGLYAVPVEFEGGVPTKAASAVDGKTYPVYCVKNGVITIKEKQYEIKLTDGYYIIRKLTVIECCRLQTMPDDYCKAVSNTQAYKGLGNGWTAEVIIHLLNHALKDVPRDEEIMVLSMYDGIGTGRYCLDKMGFTNIKYFAYEIDKYAMAIANDNYPDIIQCGDAFDLRRDDWNLRKRSVESLMQEQEKITLENETNLLSATDTVNSSIVENLIPPDEQATCNDFISNDKKCDPQPLAINTLEQLQELANERKRLLELSPKNNKYTNDIVALQHAINVLVAVGQ